MHPDHLMPVVLSIRQPSPSRLPFKGTRVNGFVASRCESDVVDTAGDPGGQKMAIAPPTTNITASIHSSVRDLGAVAAAVGKSSWVGCSLFALGETGFTR